MNNTYTLRMKPYIQPFERELATREVVGIAGFGSTLTKKQESDEYLLDCSTTLETLTSRLAYWEVVSDELTSKFTIQSLRESTVNLVRNGVALDVLQARLPFKGADLPLPNRRCLRYGTHGIHEYRGKFFPQLVRSLINISGIPTGSVVADPMSGSGTTVVEALLAGHRGIGLDMNPLSVMLANTKSQLLYAEPDALRQDYEQIRQRLIVANGRDQQNFKHFKALPLLDQDYLRAWFSDDVLSNLDDIFDEIQKMSSADSRALATIALSNILRSVSWQKEADLRVRKEIRLDVETDAKKEFLEELGRSVRAVLAFLYQSTASLPTNYVITEGDARACAETWGDNSVDLVITSPPYATALPYLDTDRLSLCYLNLLPRPNQRSRDQKMIGNREVTERLRRDYLNKYNEEKTSLPVSVTTVIDLIERLNAGTTAGFRRKNLPALLSKYFFDMSDVLLGIKRILKPGHHAFIVVGDNHTVAGGQRIEIKTAALLRDIAAQQGFEVADSLKMEMLVSRDIFKTNAGTSEEIIVLRKPV